MTRKHLLIAFAIGFGLSVLLAASLALSHRDFWGILQFPGILVAMFIWGAHSSGNSLGKEAAMVIVNGVIYGFLFLIAWGLVRLAHK